MPKSANPQPSPKLRAYVTKRDPKRTPEPFGRMVIPSTNQLFVVQQHAASHLHFDLRLELDGVLKSWAVPKGPSTDPKDKRLAMQTEDHPLDYADFEGEIPEGNYGAGHVIVWDRGRYKPLAPLPEGFDKGKLLLQLYGYKMQGIWTLVRLRNKNATGKEWLLIKEEDAYAASPSQFANTSVLSGLEVKQLADPDKINQRWTRQAKKLAGAHSRTSGGPLAGQTAKYHNTQPMLATAGTPFNRAGWLWELKYDGYRTLAKKRTGVVELTTRSGHSLSQRFPEICQVLKHLPLEDCVIDGELVVNNAMGRPDFSLLQQRARSMSTHQVAVSAVTQPASYYCFDLLGLAGIDLRHLPLLERKKLLKKIIPPHSAFIYSEHVLNRGLQVMDTATQLGIEGVVGKKMDTTYTPGRSKYWIKVRKQRTDDFVVAGWSPGRNNPRDIGALILAEYRGNNLTYVGHAGAGLSNTLRQSLQPVFKRLARKTSPLQDIPDTPRTLYWLTPKLVVEVGYAEYTRHGHLRQPAVRRLRDDKSATECIGAADTPTPAPSALPAPAVVTTNPDKVFFPKPGFTKQQVVTYYRQVAPAMLPYLEDRPIVLTRFPDGVDGKSFYQRDVPDYVPDWIRRAELWSDTEEPKPVTYFILEKAEDLAYVANMGTLPIHIWHSRARSLEMADWCVLDLDPKSAPFSDVVVLAQAIGSLADEIRLPAYVKTSGASGLHVLLPLHRQLNHEQSRTLGELLATVVVNRYPNIATITRRLRARQQKVYVDYMQNGHGRLIVAPYAVRAEAAASVSMPLHWHEVRKGLANHKYHIGNAMRRINRGPDPFAGVLTDQPDLTRSLERLQRIFAREID